jgi:hypothetical protein
VVRHLVAIGIALGMARDPGCGGGVESPSGSINAPCTRDKDCQGGLVCREGVCGGADAGAADAEPKDAAHDGP